MTLVSIVVPVFYNASAIPVLLDRLREVAEQLRPLDFEFVLIDDGSGDNSYDVIVAEAQRDPRVHGIRLSRNFGAPRAVVAGFSFARGDCQIVMAADLQDPPEFIPTMIQAWQEGAEVVLAAREGRDDPPLTKAFASIFNRTFRWLVFSDYPKDGFDFVAITRRVSQLIFSMQEKNSHIPGQVFWLGFKRKIVYYRREARSHGKSQFTFSRKIKFFIDAFVAFSYVPLRLAGLLGILLALLGFGYAAAVGVSRLTGMIIEPAGFSALMVVLLIIGGTQLVVTAIIGEYLWRVLEEARRRPLFVIDSTVNLQGAMGERVAFTGLPAQMIAASISPNTPTPATTTATSER